jgi:hypothetical protein
VSFAGDDRIRPAAVSATQVERAPDGTVYLLEDGPRGRLLRRRARR